MEQYLGQFLGNFLASLQGEPLSNTVFSGFVLLAVFTFLAYLIFRIALIALKIGTITGVLALIASMGMPSGDIQNKEVRHPNNETSRYSIPDLSSYISEEKLREVFLSYLKGIKQ